LRFPACRPLGRSPRRAYSLPVARTPVNFATPSSAFYPSPNSAPVSASATPSLTASISPGPPSPAASRPSSKLRSKLFLLPRVADSCCSFLTSSARSLLRPSRAGPALSYCSFPPAGSPRDDAAGKTTTAASSRAWGMVLQKSQRDFTDFRVQLPLVGARPRILAGLGPFVAVRASQTIRFAIEHDDQRLFHRAAYHFAQVPLNLPLINLNHLAQLRSSPAVPLVLPRAAFLPGWWAPSFLLFGPSQTLCSTNQTPSPQMYE
jgi:hypothetical protein